MAAVVGQWSSGWGPGEGMLLDVFVVGVESEFEEEDGGDASGHFLDVADFVFGERATVEWFFAV